MFELAIVYWCILAMLAIALFSVGALFFFPLFSLSLLVLWTFTRNEKTIQTVCGLVSLFFRMVLALIDATHFANKITIINGKN